LSHRQIATAVVAVLAALAVPAGASAATKVVSMGVPAPSQKAFGKYGADANEFFPTGTTIHVGDSVRFVPNGFHEVNLPKKGGGLNPLFVPTGQKVAGAVDAAGAPFWFNGADQLGFNPVLGANGFGKKFTYTGGKAVISGLPFAAKPKPMTVKFAKTGSFTYFCDVHPGMKGTVTVRSKSRSVPSTKAQANKVKAQVARDLAVAKTLSKKTAPAGTVDLGEAGKHGVEIFAMVPASRTVPVGTTLTFRMTAGSREVHTATFGPGDIEDANSFLGKLSGSLESPAPDPAALYPSDQPPAAAAFGPTTHGNGFWNSGALDALSATPSPVANAVTFTTAGTYTYYCLIHPFMKGTVVVQ
jgi:plastocyanin